MNGSESINPIELGRYMAFWFYKTPRRALHALAYYKFASRMIGPGKRVLDIGCSEGLGTWLLKAECGEALGLDMDAEAIDVARSNWTGPGIEFTCANFLEISLMPEWDAVINFDVIEHILPENSLSFIDRIAACLKTDGIAIFGTPSLPGQKYASEHTKAGHVNCYEADRLEAELRTAFENVFIFSANDEVIHTGFYPMAHYYLALCCSKKIHT